MVARAFSTVWSMIALSGRLWRCQPLSAGNAALSNRRLRRTACALFFITPARTWMRDPPRPGNERDREGNARHDEHHRRVRRRERTSAREVSRDRAGLRRPFRQPFPEPGPAAAVSAAEGAARDRLCRARLCADRRQHPRRSRRSCRSGSSSTASARGACCWPGWRSRGSAFIGFGLAPSYPHLLIAMALVGVAEQRLPSRPITRSCRAVVPAARSAGRFRSTPSRAFSATRSRR